MKRSVVLSSIVAVGVVAVAGRALVAQQPAAGAPNVANIEKVKENLYLVTGGGAVFDEFGCIRFMFSAVFTWVTTSTSAGNSTLPLT